MLALSAASHVAGPFEWDLATDRLLSHREDSLGCFHYHANLKECPLAMERFPLSPLSFLLPCIFFFMHML